MMTRVTRMLKGVFFRALGTGKVTVLAVVAALTLFTASTALGATGGNFILGVANTATDPDGTGTATGITQLTANLANPAMKLINTGTGTNATALNLQTATTKPPMTVNSKTKVANLNADSVDGKSAEQLTRVAQMNTSATTNLTNGSLGTYGTPLSITAPASGFVRVNGNVTIRNDDTTPCPIHCIAQAHVRHINTNTQSTPSQQDVTHYRGNLGLDQVFPVSTGANTFEIQLFRFGSSEGIMQGWYGTLTAEYTPYGSTGTGTLSTASAASEPSQEELDKKKKEQAETQQEQ